MEARPLGAVRNLSKHSGSEVAMPTLDPHDPAGARWARALTPSERAAQLAEEERYATSDARRAFTRALLGCAFWLLGGLTLMGMGLHTTDPELGGIYFVGGLLVAYVGIVVTVARYYLRGEEGGWW
jgi:hypothetical protein